VAQQLTMINKTIFILLISASVLYSQNLVKINIIDSSTSKPLNGARAYILNTEFKSGSDSLGTIIFENVPDGYYTFYFTYVIYNAFTINLDINAKNENLFTVKIPKPKYIGRDY
jgi:hypothetical protein